jgi:predicted house-cleaning noncanonical NTP pyrophosphatase (MazG superfamily)
VTDLINLACMHYFVSADIKDILYSVIDKIGKEKIRMEINSEIEFSEKRCDDILDECEKLMGTDTNEESLADLYEALLHFLLTASMLPSERKVNLKGTEIDIVVPSIKMLKKNPDKALVVQIIRGNEDLKKLQQTKSIQPYDENIWLVSARKLDTSHTNYYVGSRLYPYSRIILDINAFLIRKGHRGLKLLHGQ